MHSGNKVLFYFSAESRVDFRELVRDLAKSLRTRIEMRQVGSRDESKVRGGLGPCGRELCCSSWNQRFSTGQHSHGQGSKHCTQPDKNIGNVRSLKMLFGLRAELVP